MSRSGRTFSSVRRISSGTESSSSGPSPNNTSTTRCLSHPGTTSRPHAPVPRAEGMDIVQSVACDEPPYLSANASMSASFSNSDAA